MGTKRCGLLPDRARQAEAIDVEWLVAKPASNFLTFDDEEQIVGPVQRVEGHQMIVICQLGN